MPLLKSLAAYQTIKLLSTPFKKWTAYKLGLIDEKGNTLREPETKEEKDSLNLFDRVIKNIKKLIMKAPMGAFTIGSLAVALKLLKEETGHSIEFDILKHLSDSDITLNLNENDNSKEHFESGKYVELTDNKMFIISEEIFPCDIILGCPIYEVEDVVTGNVMYVARDHVKRV